jgi:hypothetical protein
LSTHSLHPLLSSWYIMAIITPIRPSNKLGPPTSTD